MRSLVFVSYEIYPFTEGGIGRVLYNIFNTMCELDRKRAKLILVDTKVDASRFGAIIPNIKLISVDTGAGDAHSSSRLPAVAYSNTRRHWHSAVIFREIKRLSCYEQIEYIEFPDWGGLAFCTLQERLLTGLLNDTTIAIRLHSAHTVIANAEPHLITETDLNVCDLERKCLRDCDVIIAQLPSVSQATKRIFGFAASEWDDRVVIHAPPVLQVHTSTPDASIPFEAAQPILFTSKIQRFKRPDVFIRGVCQFLRTHPGYTGNVVFAASRGVDIDFEWHVKSLIPDDLRGRFLFKSNLLPIEREALVATGTVVVPSAFESFCLVAYEASLSGARVILNGCNPAFDNTTPWIDGVNCFKFDGSIAGLAEALTRNYFSHKPLLPVALPKGSWPWKLFERDATHFKQPTEAPLVTVIIHDANEGQFLMETIETVFNQTYKNIEIIVIGRDLMSFADSNVKLFCDNVRTRLTILQLPSNVGRAAACNAGIEASSGCYVLPIQAGSLLGPHFLSLGVAALENNAAFSVVVPQVAFFDDKGLRDVSNFPIRLENYVVCSGEAILAGTIENRFSTAIALFRKNVFDHLRYIEDLNCYEDWSLYLRMCDLGMRFIVTTDIHCFCRQHPNSLTHYQAAIAYSDLIRTSAPGDLRRKSRHLAVSTRSASLMGSVIHDTPIPAGYGTTPFDEAIVFGSLRISHFLHGKAPTILKFLLALGRRAWRLIREHI